MNSECATTSSPTTLPEKFMWMTPPAWYSDGLVVFWGRAIRISDS